MIKYKKWWVGVLATSGLVACGISGLRAIALTGPDGIEHLKGDWVVTSRAITGIADPRFGQGRLSVTDELQAALAAPNESQISLQFQPQVLRQDGGTRLMVETSEDRTEWGGGGARKAICKINAAGELEIVEARSSAYDYPADFSSTTKRNAISWTLTPAK